ncbi:hypothetical protein M5K25_010948 [Dendrobium thyrsiflorum]|uniref:MADS-box domain-containing protein n=1 Tax=Dendrobium thyrsiflorum TaxID=117978 RepID=A0ABD0V1X0_DENTH
MRKGKTEIKRIDNADNRHLTFCKRKGELLTKAYEFNVLTDAEIGLIIFSGRALPRKLPQGRCPLTPRPNRTGRTPPGGAAPLDPRHICKTYNFLPPLKIKAGSAPEHQEVIEQQVVEEHKVKAMNLLERFDLILHDSRSFLQLGPQMHSFKLQQTKPNLQGSGLRHDHGLEL